MVVVDEQQSGPTEDANPVLIISHEVVGTYMAGPGIRYYHLARVLAQSFPVILAVPARSTLAAGANFSLLRYASGQDLALEKAIRQARAVLIPAVWLTKIAALLQTETPLIIDGYDPCLAETLAWQKGEIESLQAVLSQAYLVGDFFICASERQRDWWLGLLEAHGRINVQTFEDDPSLRRLVDLVPFGLPEEPPRRTQAVIKGVWPGIAASDRLILWGGGLWPWLDPLTAIRAIAEVWRQRQDIRLVFPGTRHPNAHLADLPTHLQEAIRLAEALDLLDRAVFFGEWIPYEDWPGVLLESDLALTLHADTLETRLAFRTRALYYIWAGVPIIATRGDAISELVEKFGLGVVVDYEDAAGVAQAILRLLEMSPQTLAAGFEQARQVLRWDEVIRPLVEFCRCPRRAPDKIASGAELGNPFYRQRIAALQRLVTGYEQGRLMRSLRWLHRMQTGLQARWRK